MSDHGVQWRDWSGPAAAEWVAVPQAGDDKYSRGVLGVATGSDRYPGAAVLGVGAAVRTGLGMVRYLGDERPSALVLQARPEVVTAPGRVQAWLLGSGMAPDDRSDATTRILDHALSDGVPLVIDAGALDVIGRVTSPAVLTPHAGELVTVLKAAGTVVQRTEVQDDPARWAQAAADATGHVVLLKGRSTHICSPQRDGGRTAVRVEAPSSWAATAGSGDVLGGILGALVATHAEAAADPENLVALAATAAYIHAWSADHASAGAPIAALDIVAAIPAVLARLLASRPTA